LLLAKHEIASNSYKYAVKLTELMSIKFIMYSYIM